jgi:hypothetical protein
MDAVTAHRSEGDGDVKFRVLNAGSRFVSVVRSS